MSIKYNHYFPVAAALLLCLVTENPAAAADLLVKNGVASGSIVLPSGATGRVSTAAQNLAAYLQQMSGATIPVVEDSAKPAGYNILIGSTSLARVNRSEVSFEKVGHDGFIIKSVPGGVVIAGRDDLGTTHGVYYFAEKVLGIHWYSVEDDGPTIPKRRMVKIKDLNLTVKPTFGWRSQYFSFQQVVEAYAKNQTPLAKKLLANRDRWWVFNRLWAPIAPETGHMFMNIVPQSTFDTHPEYFPYIDYSFAKDSRIETPAGPDGSLISWPWKPGRYKGDDSFQRCLSNPDIVRITAELTAMQFENDPNLEFTSLSASDGPWWCVCDGCKKMGATHSERNLEFVNTIAKANEEKYPDRGYIFCAYWATLDPPKGKKAHPSLIPLVAPLWQCRIHPISSDCPDMVYLREVMDGWRKVSDRTAYRPYMSAGPFTFPGVVALAEEMRYARDHDSIGGFREYQFGPQVNWAMLAWAEIQLFWDVDRDPKQLRKEFIAGYYGKAASKPIGRIYSAIESGVRTAGHRTWPEDDGSGLHSLPAEEILEPMLDKARKDIASALKIALSQPEPFRSRIIRDIETLVGKNREPF